MAKCLAAMWQADDAGIKMTEPDWPVMVDLIQFLESHWQDPDEGIWEVRGGRQHFTHSKMMAWVALDRTVRTAEELEYDGPTERWRALRARIHEDVCRQGFNRQLGAFVQSYGSATLDASLLLMPLVGFLPADDPRVRGTVSAIERDLTIDGFVRRYHTE